MLGVAGVLSIVSCSAAGPETSGAGTWVGTITTEGAITTVVNEAGGRFLGGVDLPQTVRFSSKPFMKDNTILLVREDDVGTIMVKRYRLVMPGEAR